MSYRRRSYRSYKNYRRPPTGDWGDWQMALALFAFFLYALNRWHAWLAISIGALFAIYVSLLLYWKLTDSKPQVIEDGED